MFNDNEVNHEIRFGQAIMAALNFANRVLRFVTGNPEAEFKLVNCEFARLDTKTVDHIGVTIEGRIQVPGLSYNPKITIFFSLGSNAGEWQLNTSDAQIMFDGPACLRKLPSGKFEPGNEHSKQKFEVMHRMFKTQ